MTDACDRFHTTFGPARGSGRADTPPPEPELRPYAVTLARRGGQRMTVRVAAADPDDAKHQAKLSFGGRPVSAASAPLPLA
jgi:hypothetical protein